MVADIIREVRRVSKSVEIVREGEPLPENRPILRISGAVIEFKPGSRAKRYLIGFGAGSTVVKAQVKFIDAASNRLIMDRAVSGITWMGIAGGSSDSAGDRLGKKVAGLAKSNHLLEEK